MSSVRVTAAVVALVCVAPRLTAQSSRRLAPCAAAPAGDPAGWAVERTRAAELAGELRSRPWLVRRPSDGLEDAACAARGGIPPASPGGATSGRGGSLALLPLRWSAEANTAYPRDRNNGALWAGRGTSTALDGGFAAAVRFGRVRLSLAGAPRLLYHQNRAFELAPGGGPARDASYPNPWHRGLIDWPQRPGGAPFWVLDPGQSHVRLDAFGAAVGVSTENLWWGPALRNPLLMSNTAPGFPHVFMGTSGPTDVRIGRIEARLIWGRLEESEYFDQDDANDRRLFAGLVADFEPRWLPGLYLGLARAYLRVLPPEPLPLVEYLLEPYLDVRSNAVGSGAPGADNQLVAVFARWAHPGAGFEVYAEWAREDHWADFANLLAEPDASQAYTLGFQRLVPVGSRWLRLAGELTHLSDALPINHVNRGVLSYYVHTQVRQGYTHRGQLLGAAIGPGSDAQYLAADLLAESIRTGLFLERVRYDDDAYNALFERTYGPDGHDLELTAGVRHARPVGALELDAELAYSRRYNRNFLGLDGVRPARRVEGNWYIRLGLAWDPGLALR